MQSWNMQFRIKKFDIVQKVRHQRNFFGFFSKIYGCIFANYAQVPEQADKKVGIKKNLLLF